MLTIRPDQLAVFEAEALRRFEAEALAHAREFWLARCAERGADGTRALVAKAIARSERYGIEDREAVLGYLDLMFALGEDFDSDPDLPWAADVLADGDATDLERMDVLVELAAEHLEQKGS